MFQAQFLYQIFLGGGVPSGKDQDDLPLHFLALAILIIIIPTFIRWFLIPKQKTRHNVLVMMIIGLAIAEFGQFFQLFIIGNQFPETQLSMFILSTLAVGQFAPTYVK